MRITIRAKMMLAFLAVAAVCLFVGVVIPLQVSMRGFETENQTLLRGQITTLEESIAEWVKNAKEVSSAIRDATPIRSVAEQGDFERIKSITESFARQQVDPRLEVFILPRERAAQLKNRINRILGLGQFPLIRQSDLGITESGVNGVQKAYTGDLNIIEDENQRILATVFVGLPLLEDLRPDPLPSDMFQKGSAFIEEIRDTYNLSAEIEFIAPGSEKFQAFLATQPDLKEALLGGKKSAFADNWLQRGVLWQVGFFPMVDLDGEVISIAFFRVPKPSVLKFWKDVQFTFYIALLVTVPVVILLVVRLSRSVARPIRRLSERARAVASGELDEAVDVRTHDEIADLAEAFNTMQVELKRTLEELKVRADTIEKQNRRLDQTIQELSRMQNYTENILQNVKNGVITFDLNSRITKINSAAIRILEADGASISDTETYIGRTELGLLVESGLASGKTVTGQEIHVATYKGHTIPIDLSTSLLRANQEAIGLVATFRDLSRLKVLEEQIRRADRLASLGHLSAGVAHEIRNPLGIIKGCASILHRRFGGWEGEEGLTDSIVQEVDRLSAVVTNFLDFARPKPPSIVMSNVNAVVEKALHLAELHGLGKKITVKNDLSPDLPRIPIDPEQCEQVFLNLVLNALEAMEKGGTLTVSSHSSPEENEAVVSVTDTGVGIDPELRERIFDPFFTGKSQGTGLGLSVTHMIVEAHDGRIEVESEPGKGSTFRVCLPLSQKDV